MLTRQPVRPKCTSCNLSYAKPNGQSKHGFQKWHKYCVDCAKALYNIAYRDLNPANKSKENILTICANCSRLRKKRVRESQKQMEMSVDSTIRI